ncbi:hypothetical protein CAPTEDRAFT_181900 [Capitella teleta]|uniref:RING-type E3 ubiquitin transferase n=1 Tax=Capitella teleta TaxID=283909 RepID=R7U0B0_CAPTE|nr:hypothetical protein CAPTEDRAFT_181900 [Capitella teleta]|eukprot:ELT99643.1 hypothetical protein CAPTEDRAFT_181900 [Capitella teleta]
MSDNTPSDHCPLCHEVVDVFAVGQCDHPVCFKCSTRMRALCDQLYCAICRANLPKVLFTEKRCQFNSTKTNSFMVYRKLNIFFENRALQDRFFKLLEHRCKLCPPSDVKPFRTFSALQNHMRREHNENFCELCLDNVKIFSSERKTYDRKKLAEHRRQGDEDDKSHKGHPLCQFCDLRFFDNDALVLHLRKQHYFCHFCEADGVTNEFFDEYNYLREHFRDEHYLCEEGECADTEFTNAFRSDIDLRAHRASEHSKNMKKAAAKQARRIDIDFSYSGRPSEYPSRGGGRGRGRGSNERQERVITAEDYEEVQQDRKSLRQQRQQERSGDGYAFN